MYNWLPDSDVTALNEIMQPNISDIFMYARPLSAALQVLNLQMADGAQGDGHADDTKLHGKPDKTLRFSLCSDNLEGISEGQSAVWWYMKLKEHKINVFYLMSE